MKDKIWGTFVFMYFGLYTYLSRINDIWNKYYCP